MNKGKNLLSKISLNEDVAYLPAGIIFIISIPLMWVVVNGVVLISSFATILMKSWKDGQG